MGFIAVDGRRPRPADGIVALAAASVVAGELDRPAGLGAVARATMETPSKSTSARGFGSRTSAGVTRATVAATTSPRPSAYVSNASLPHAGRRGRA